MQQPRMQLWRDMHASIGKERIKKSIGMGYFFLCAATRNKKISLACTQLQQRFEDNNRFQSGAYF
jgi:hypothetical protein